MLMFWTNNSEHKQTAPKYNKKLSEAIKTLKI